MLCLLISNAEFFGERETAKEREGESTRAHTETKEKEKEILEEGRKKSNKKSKLFFVFIFSEKHQNLENNSRLFPTAGDLPLGALIVFQDQRGPFGLASPEESRKRDPAESTRRARGEEMSTKMLSPSMRHHSRPSIALPFRRAAAPGAATRPPLPLPRPRR